MHQDNFGEERVHRNIMTWRRMVAALKSAARIAPVGRRFHDPHAAGQAAFLRALESYSEGVPDGGLAFAQFQPAHRDVVTLIEWSGEDFPTNLLAIFQQCDRSHVYRLLPVVASHLHFTLTRLV
jgi:hypothetical protein